MRGRIVAAMKPIRSLKYPLSLAALALLAIPSFTQADVKDRLYDFTDAYYTQNGINPGRDRRPAPTRSARGDRHADLFATSGICARF